MMWPSLLFFGLPQLCTAQMTGASLRKHEQQQAMQVLNPAHYPDRVLTHAIQTIHVGEMNTLFVANRDAQLDNVREQIARDTPRGIEVLMTLECASLAFFARVDKASLVQTTTQRTAMRPAPDTQFKQATLHLAPGAPLLVGECVDAMCHVTLHPSGYAALENPYQVLDENLVADGWVPSPNLGRMYRPDDLAQPQTDHCVWIEQGTILHDKVSGEAVLEFASSVAWTASSTDDGTLVIQQSRITAAGGIYRPAVSPSSCATGGSGGGCGWGASHVERISLPAGAPVFEHVDGSVIGAVTADESFRLLRRQGAWAEIDIPSTRWEGLTFWVRTD